MSRIHNGMRASELRGITWVKSSWSGPTAGNCVGGVRLRAFLAVSLAVRNSRHPAGPALIFTATEWDAFIHGVKAGQNKSPGRQTNRINVAGPAYPQRDPPLPAPGHARERPEHGPRPSQVSHS